MKFSIKNLTTKKSLRIILPVAFILVLIASVVLTQDVKMPVKGDDTAKPVSAAEYQQSLKAQVDNADGSPTSGRNPADQSQTSLSAAASTPSGTGMRTDTPAAGVTGSNKSVTSADVYGTPEEQRAKGINAAGCFYDYGIPGQECMPAGMANAQGQLECPMVRSHFPNGLKVSGTDRFKLDTNGDKVACGPGDK